MRRARETVAPYAQRADVDVHFDQDLAEANIGAWENKSFEEILESDDRILHHAPQPTADMGRDAPGAEELQAFRTRVGEAIERILAGTEGDVLIV